MSASPYNPDARGAESANGKDSAMTMLHTPAQADADNGNYGRPSRSLPPGEQTDEQLLSDYRHGDKAAFSKLVSRYQRELYHFLVRFLGNRASAEDVFQETFLQVHQSAEQFDPQRRFRPWLFTIAANKARDLIRSQARRPTNPLQASISPGDNDSGEFIDLMQSTDNLPSDPMEKRELQEQVHNTVTAMPEHLREILLLSYFHQFPYKQISEILDIPLGTVKSRLHAAVAHFADRWRAANQTKSLA
ncbi:MAG TPA: sigma-70 family RNA polymerase sigma factor [Tepidisphaeraceae bacterium]|jgi:RNA polymerase sigma-70 factor (ECF subfamily)